MAAESAAEIAVARQSMRAVDEASPLQRRQSIMMARMPSDRGGGDDESRQSADQVENVGCHEAMRQSK